MSPSPEDPGRPGLPVESLTRALVRPGSLWTSIRVSDRLESTNADLVAAAAGGAAEGTVVVAEHQSGGRGRLGRGWQSPPRAGLTFSALLRPPLPRSAWGWLPLLAGVSVARALDHIADVDSAVKWPNDVLAGSGRRKVAGLLAEVAAGALVIGIGVNVSTTREELPADGATSLALEHASCTDRAPLLIAILRAVADDYREWLGGGDVRRAYLAACATLGQRVRVSLPAAIVVGEAVDVDEGGRLVIAGDDGTLTAVAAGDVVHVRRATG